MTSKLNIIVIGFTLALMVTIGIVLTPSRSYALFDNAKNATCGGINVNATNTTCVDGSGKLNDIVALVINTLSVIVGIVAIIMIIIAGFKFLTSQGDANATASARTTIIYAIIGLVIVAMAQIIVKFVLNKITS